MHDLCPAVAVRLTAGRPALRAAARLVLQPTRLVELLLPGREQEFTAAVATGQSLIHEAHGHRQRPPLEIAPRPGRCGGRNYPPACAAILTRLPNIWRRFLTDLYPAATALSSSSSGAGSNPWLGRAAVVRGTSFMKTVATSARPRTAPADRQTS